MSEHPSEEKPLPTVSGVCLTSYGRRSSRSSPNAIRPRTPGAAASTSGPPWTPSSSDCVLVASGTTYLPKEFPDDSSVHRTFQRWVELGVLERIWAASVEECEELGGVDWEWQAADGAMGLGPVLGGPHGPQPHRHSQERREALPAGRGRRRTTGGSGGRGERARRQAAGRNPPRRRSARAPRADRRGPSEHLCLDKGYDNGPAREVVEDRDYAWRTSARSARRSST